MTLKNLLPYIRWTIRRAKTGEEIRAVAQMLEYWIPDKIETQEELDTIKSELLDEFDFMVAGRECIYTK